MKPIILPILLAASLTALAQTNPPAVEDFKPATTNQRGREYPRVNSEGRVRARISAPQAQKVELEVNGIRYPMTKDPESVWTGNSAPLDEGNHYYGLVIGGAACMNSLRSCSKNDAPTATGCPGFPSTTPRDRRQNRNSPYQPGILTHTQMPMPVK